MRSFFIEMVTLRCTAYFHTLCALASMVL